jgi:hypothetical protein
MNIKFVTLKQTEKRWILMDLTRDDFLILLAGPSGKMFSTKAE